MDKLSQAKPEVPDFIQPKPRKRHTGIKTGHNRRSLPMRCPKCGSTNTRWWPMLSLQGCEDCGNDFVPY